MDQLIMPKERISIKQRNTLTNAHYDFSEAEKNILYYIIKELQVYMASEKNQTLDHTIFNDLIVRIDKDHLMKIDTNLHRIKEAAIRLRKRSISMNAGTSKSPEWGDVGFINYSEYKKGVLEVEMSRKVLPYIIAAYENFTEYSFIIALSLNGMYAKRFYEWCNQWKGTGFWTISLDELRKALKLENKYKQYYDFKRVVIETAQRELDRKSDVTFRMKELKGKGKKIEGFEFIITNKRDQANQDREKIKSLDSFRYTMNFIDKMITNDKKYKERVADWLLSGTERTLTQVFHRIEKLDDDISAGMKTKSDVARLIRHILKNDFYIK